MTSGPPDSAGGVILLAAGRSRRFGSDKRAHRLPDGRSLLTHSLERYGAAFDRCILVIRSDDASPVLAEQPREEFSAEFTIVRAELADLGMGHSLAAGARAAAAAGWRYVFVALADMPWVECATLAGLRNAMERAVCAGNTAAIVQPLFAGAPGHPVGFAAGHIAALGTLSGDAGARSVVQRDAARVLHIETDDPGVLQDLDTPGQAPTP